MNRIPVGAVAGALACLACFGCDRGWHTETHPATGRITINGQPPAGALVQFYSAGEKVDARDSRPWAVVEEDGTFTLSTYEKGDGAPAGEYLLTVTWPWDVTKPSPADRLNRAYATPEQSSWRMRITEGPNELPPVEIVGAKVAQNPNLAAPRQARAPSGMTGIAPRQ